MFETKEDIIPHLVKQWNKRVNEKAGEARNYYPALVWNSVNEPPEFPYNFLIGL